MGDSVYQLCIGHLANNPFRKYLEFLYELDELTEDEKHLYQSIGREFINLIETTNMTKVYKIPVLMTFYNNGNVRMAVTEDELLEWWKEFRRSSY